MTEAAEGTQAPRKKHRHDLGQEDHGPELAGRTTKVIQVLLGLWVTLTVGLVIYAVVEMARAPASPDEPGRPTPTAR